MKALVIQPVLAHYRQSLFQSLVGSMEQQWVILGGDGGFGLKTFTSSVPRLRDDLTNRFFRVGRHTFVWQGGALRALWRERPDVVVLTGVDLHILSNLTAAVVARTRGTKVIWWGHGSLGDQGWFGKAIRRFFFRRAVGVFTYGEYARDAIVREGIMRAERVGVLKNCINSMDYGFLNGHGGRGARDHGDIRVLFSGRLTRSKRADVLVRAVACLRGRKLECHCDVIGDGEELENLRGLARELNISDRVTFHGALYGEAVTPFFTGADLFVLPGKVGLSVIHSLSFGLPVLTTDCMELHSPEVEIIRAGETGDFFRGFDPDALADTIAAWETKLRVDRVGIADRCVRSITEQQYLPELMAAKMQRLVERWCNEPSPVREAA